MSGAVGEVAEAALTLAAPEVAAVAALGGKLGALRPSPAAIAIALLAATTAVQTVRIEGIHANVHIGRFSFPFLNLDGLKDKIAADAKAQAVWARAFALEQNAYRTMAHAVSVQNAGIDQWAKDARARQLAAQQALRAAQAREKDREAAAVRIDRDVAQLGDAVPAPDCRTPASVMAARGQL